MNIRIPEARIKRNVRIAEAKVDVIEILFKLEYYEDMFTVLGELTTQLAGSMYRQNLREDEKES